MSLTLEARIEALELEVKELSRRMIAKPGPRDWQKTIGASENDPGFDEMIRLGREIREKERPKKL